MIPLFIKLWKGIPTQIKIPMMFFGIFIIFPATAIVTYAFFADELDRLHTFIDLIRHLFDVHPNPNHE